MRTRMFRSRNVKCEKGNIDYVSVPTLLSIYPDRDEFFWKCSTVGVCSTLKGPND